MSDEELLLRGGGGDELDGAVDVGAEVAVREEGALGAARRAGGVDDRGDVVVRDARGGEGARRRGGGRCKLLHLRLEVEDGAPRDFGGGAVLLPVDEDDGRKGLKAGGDLLQDGEVARVGVDGLHAGVAHHVGDFLGAELRVDRDDRDGQRGVGEVELDPDGAVVEDDRHGGRARPDAERCRHLRHPGNADARLAVGALANLLVVAEEEEAPSRISP